MQNDKNYRPEIDGLRAIAVLPVILFHAGLPFFDGGFIGVDIFFVISGFLITSIILRELQLKKFSIVKFYERRARRILPALFVMILVFIPLFWHYMLPGEFKRFSISIVATLFFSSNILFWRESGYFHPDSEEKPLLHTWSLAVEEHYYILFPLFMMLFWSFGKRILFVCLLVLSVLSLALSEYIVANTSGNSAFFLIPTRAWELLVGSLGAFVYRDLRNRLPVVVPLAGLLMLIFSFVTVNPLTPWPSMPALIPVVGTVLILLGCKENDVVYKVLSFPVFVFVGLISYSAYLYHQPLFALARLKFDGHPPQSIMIALSIVTMVLAYLSWKFVERPFRAPSTADKSVPIVVPSIALAGVLAVVGVAGIISDGGKFRYDKGDWQLVTLSTNDHRAYVRARFNKAKRHVFSDDGKKKLVLIGDSYAQDFSNVLAESGVLDTYELSTHLIESQCGNLLLEPFPENELDEDAKTSCSGLTRYPAAVIERIRAADKVILASSWKPWVARYLDQSVANIQAITDADVLVVTGKRFSDPSNSAFLDSVLGLSTAEKIAFRDALPEQDILAYRQIQTTSGLSVVDLISLYCTDTGCQQFDESGRLLSFDRSHLTREGVEFFASLIKNDETWVKYFVEPTLSDGAAKN